jgi:2-polyprenyl-3-methyl-5-hydroxy-6-metoxy-1,4-benzoquinol methylase
MKIIARFIKKYISYLCGINDLSQSISSIDAGTNEKFKKLEEKIEKLQHSTNALFKYQTSGLELYPEKEERIISYDYNSAQISHITRYVIAKDIIKIGDNVLDIACGVGYGSRYLSDLSEAENIIGVDISKSTINYATKVFGTENINFIHGSALDKDLFPNDSFDKIVSFETIEHLENDEKLISNLYYWLRKGGSLIGSVPNQDIQEYNKMEYPFHIRHYTPLEFSNLLSSSGFKVEIKYVQSGEMFELEGNNSFPARNLVYIAKKM